MAAAQTTAGYAPIAAVTGTVAPEGCADDISQQCADIAAGSAQSQCLTSKIGSVSEACRAALAQTPPAGMAKHLGDDPTPVTTPPAPLAVTLPNFVAPKMPVQASAPVGSPPPPVRLAPTVVLAPPLTTVDKTPAPVTLGPGVSPTE